MKMDKILVCKSEVSELKKEIQAKRVMIRLMKQQRDDAQTRVNSERHIYRDELFKEVGGEIHQLDERHLNSLSSDFGNFDQDSLGSNNSDEEGSSKTEDSLYP